jgi:hypothetical protein
MCKTSPIICDIVDSYCESGLVDSVNSKAYAKTPTRDRLDPYAAIESNESF